MSHDSKEEMHTAKDGAFPTIPLALRAGICSLEPWFLHHGEVPQRIYAEVHGLCLDDDGDEIPQLVPIIRALLPAFRLREPEDVVLHPDRKSTRLNSSH